MHIKTMKPVHDDLIMESGMHVMSVKSVFKGIQSNRPQTYEELTARFNSRTAKMAVPYQCIDNVLHVTTDANWASQDEPQDDLLTYSSITSGMPSLA